MFVVIPAVPGGGTSGTAPAAGQTARGLQARLLQEPDLVDAVPEAGQVRIVRAAASGSDRLRGPLQHAKVEPALPRFEDAFMVLLRWTVGDSHRGACLIWCSYSAPLVGGVRSISRSRSSKIEDLDFCPFALERWR